MNTETFINMRRNKPDSIIATKGRLQKKTLKSLVFYPPGGGWLLEGSKKPNLYFGKVFFQLAWRTILETPNHTWSEVVRIYIKL